MIKKINKLVIFGVGLIGGSFALALKKANAVNHVVGIGRHRDNLVRAQALGVIDEISDNARAALKDADLIFLAVPVRQIPEVMKEIAPHLNKGTIVTDAGSTKQEISSEAYRYFSKHIEHFIPGHPIAGAERSGVEAACDDLYHNKKVILTPLVENNPQSLQLVREVWQLCGAQVYEMNAFEHDAIFAAVSHLPHVLAYTLVHMIATKPNAAQLFNFAGSGFRDSTRIASSHPELWRDICMTNQRLLLKEMDHFIDHLTHLRRLMANFDAEGIEKFFTQAREARQIGVEKEEEEARKNIQKDKPQ